MATKYIFETLMQVRDYECDIEGIVNNANYLHYCEHTRHLFLKECGLSFAEMHEKGVDAVVARMSMQFKIPLRPDDEFVSRLGLTKEGIKYVFHHDLYRCEKSQEAGDKGQESLCFRAKVELVCIVDGRLSESEDYDRAFAHWLE